MAEKIPLKVDLVSVGDAIPEPQQGKLYFVEGESTVYKDAVHGLPFSGINRVTFEIDDENPTATVIKFNTDYGTDGNAGKLVVGNDVLIALVNSINTRLTKVEEDINELNLTNVSVVNLDKTAPKPSGNWTLSEAVNYVSNLSIPKENVGVMFNDGTTVKIYFFTNSDITRIKDISLWKDVQIGSGIEVVTYDSRLAFPAIGSSNTTYIDKETGMMYYWNDDRLIYIRIGLDKEDLKFIDANF